MFQFLLPQEQSIGICLDGTSIRKAILGLSKGKVTIQELSTNESLGKKNANIATTLLASKTLVRSFEIALTKQKDVDAAYTFEAEAHIPYSQEECLVDKITLSRGNGTTQLQLFAMRKADLQAHLDALQEKSINPDVIVPKPLALCHFVQQFYKQNELTIAIDVDAIETTCVLLRDGLPLMARSHPVGLDALAGITYVDQEGNVLINEGELPALEHYFREISRILFAFENGYDAGSLPILFTGPIVSNDILIQLFLNATKRVLASNPALSHQKYSWNQLLIYAVPIGVALSIELEQKGKSLNFRKNEFAYPDRWRPWKKELTYYFSLMFLLAGASFALGQAKLSQQRVELVEQYANLLQIMERPQGAETLIAMTPDEIDGQLYTLDKELKETRDEMALHPDVPRVSDLLAWLASHPNVVIAGDDPKSLSLESLSYSMVKRPEKGKLKEHYQVRVELEFSSPTPTLAREFHDALLAPNPFVDPKTELKWSVQRGHFRASFFLKDRTKYPQNFLGGKNL